MIGSRRRSVSMPWRDPCPFTCSGCQPREGSDVKVLLAIDGSPHSEAAIAEVARRPWPAETEVLVLTVIHAATPVMPDPSFALAAAHVQQIQELREQAPALVSAASEQLRRSVSDLTVLTTVDEGRPKDVILQTARFSAGVATRGSDSGEGPVNGADAPPRFNHLFGPRWWRSVRPHWTGSDPRHFESEKETEI